MVSLSHFRLALSSTAAPQQGLAARDTSPAPRFGWMDGFFCFLWCAFMFVQDILSGLILKGNGAPLSRDKPGSNLKQLDVCPLHVQWGRLIIWLARAVLGKSTPQV